MPTSINVEQLGKGIEAASKGNIYGLAYLLIFIMVFFSGFLIWKQVDNTRKKLDEKDKRDQEEKNKLWHEIAILREDNKDMREENQKNVQQFIEVTKDTNRILEKMQDQMEISDKRLEKIERKLEV